MHLNRPPARDACSYALVLLALQSIGNVILADDEAGPDRTLVAPGSTQLVANLPSGWTATWTQVGGLAATIATPGSASTDVVISQPGRLRFQLDAVATDGSTLSDEVDVFAFGNANSATVTGGAKLWHPVQLDFDHGTSLNENGTPNPFLDRRLDVTFWHEASGEMLSVPGFFAADGDAADTSADAGRWFRARFTPSKAGTWRYLASARSGAEVAVASNHLAGTSAPMDRATGSFSVGPADLDAPGNLAKGMLRYIGQHHLVFEGTGERYIKTGADSPENWLGYHEFDQTYDLGGLWAGNLPNGLHRFAPHVSDFRALDNEGQAAMWSGGQGSGILGALDYLESRGVNSIYFLTYNIDGGDGQDTWPWTSPTERLRYDVSKLEQWERVFSYADARGIHLHVVLQETENDAFLGGLSTVRRLYHRELVARFAHHLALQWNLGEENVNSIEERRQFARHIEVLDAYEHPVTFHTNYGTSAYVYSDYHGDVHFDGTSIQGDAVQYHANATLQRELSENAGRPWVVYGDEQGPAVDAGMNNLEHMRKHALYGNLMGGGAGVEWYFGYQNAVFGDIQLEDFSLAEPLWEMSAAARDFLEDHVNIERLSPDPWLTLESDDTVLAEEGQTYLVYRSNGGSATLDLGNAQGTFDVRWFDPEHGGDPLIGSVATITGPGHQSIGSAPFSGDALAYISGGTNRRPTIYHPTVEPSVIRSGDDLVVRMIAQDPDGPADLAVVGFVAFGPGGGYLGPRLCNELSGRRYAASFSNLNLGTGVFLLIPFAVDRAGAYRLGTPIGFQVIP
ncbi:MAG: DUF5060 domain-containing protein [Planctomycetota bacterium]